MIILSEIAQKIENILNGVDNETSSFLRPFDYEFKVATQGFHIDHIKDTTTGKNFIPVFVESMGGNFDAIQDLGKADFTISTTLYFPVRFKDDFYAINEFLVKCFVATRLNYGIKTGKCLSNISVAEYGEIQDLDFNEFNKWVGSVYREQINVMEKYMSMRFNLYLTSVNKEFIFANDVDYFLNFAQPRRAFGYDDKYYYFCEEFNQLHEDTLYYAWCDIEGNLIYTLLDLWIAGNNPLVFDKDFNEIGVALGGTFNATLTIKEKLIWTTGGTGMAVSPISQQIIDNDEYARNIVNITNFNKAILVTIKDNLLWNILLHYYNKQRLQYFPYLTLQKVYNLPSEKVLTYNYEQVILSLNENLEKGNLLSFTITFGDK